MQKGDIELFQMRLTPLGADVNHYDDQPLSKRPSCGNLPFCSASTSAQRPLTPVPQSAILVLSRLRMKILVCSAV